VHQVQNSELAASETYMSETSTVGNQLQDGQKRRWKKKSITHMFKSLKQTVGEYKR